MPAMPPSAKSGSTAQSQAAGTQAAQATCSPRKPWCARQAQPRHTVIISPVDGTVVARDVSVGQTVAASLQTPTLFAIAQNLSKMEVDINVGEPDIGNVKAGERVDFSVLALPQRKLPRHGRAGSHQSADAEQRRHLRRGRVRQQYRRQTLAGNDRQRDDRRGERANALAVPIAALHTPTAATTPWGT